MSAFGPQTAAAHGLAICHSCARVQPLEAELCSRCGGHLHLRKPNSLQRTWALLGAAMLLYLPANLMPMMRTTGFGGGEERTIISGVFLFWEHRAYPVAIIIFVASVIIPILKLIAIVTLCLATKRCQSPRRMTKIYRMTELVGRWSMVDVFVVAILVALVQLGNLMSIEPGSAAVAFAAVVILTMLSAMSFDPRLVWDAAGGPGTQPESIS